MCEKVVEFVRKILRFIENTISRLRRAINKFLSCRGQYFITMIQCPQILNFELADILDKGKEINVPARISINYDHLLGIMPNDFWYVGPFC